MARCACCGKMFFFGGVRDQGVRFCNETCQARGYVETLAKEVPQELVSRRVDDIHQGACPLCQGRGPVDLHTSYRIYSLLLFTSWESVPHVCCRSCGMKRQVGNMMFSLVLGWWGFPFGLVMTPVQVLRNLKALVMGPDARVPSQKLEQVVRLSLAEEFLENQASKAA
ncbi:hypothetical protein [Desulfoluna sp.]|uniref:hypothetical protein n=1 Tax=Desulfoluna sp. TaxID=2045199 RepID=UPI002620141D|nr:hypothetical protein [Desulfoluna sp.]